MSVRSRGRPRWLPGAAPTLLLLLVGCAYFNSLYNARRLFSEAEADRWSGRPSQARTKYDQAIQKAASSFRSDPEGRWADDALVLMGRAYLQRGEYEKARGALRHALEISRDEKMRARARVYLGAVDIVTGSPAQGVALLDSALVAVSDEEVRSEGHLWRARGNLRLGRADPAWQDLDAAGQAGERLRMEAEATRLGWGVEAGDSLQAFRGSSALLSSPEGRAWADSIAAVSERARRVWGPGAGATMLEGAETAPWPPADRNRLVLSQARLAASAGDTARALEGARRVARTVGPIADEARVLEARWRLPGISEIQELDAIRDLLLPAVGSRQAVAILGWIKKVGLMVEEATNRAQPLSLFAAAEMARDSLRAPLLAKDLFLVYADRAEGASWEGKALLAAMQLSSDPAEEARLRTRLEGMSENVYVQAWKNEEKRQLDYVVVERRLSSALDNVRTRIATQAEERDVLVSQTARMLDSIRTEEEIRRRLAEGDSLLRDSLRADSIRRDSIRQDSVMRADSLARDTAFFRDDSFPPDTSRSGGVPRPVLVPYRQGVVPGSVSPVLRSRGEAEEGP